MMTDREQAMQSCMKLLDDAKKEGLEVEVIFWALKAMKNDPSLTEYEALREGYDEWIK